METQVHTDQSLHLCAIVGSVRRDRLGSKVAEWFIERAALHAHLGIDLLDLAEIDLPLDGTRPGGSSASPVHDRLTAADGFVVITPEYNHSYPAALKNLIDWHLAPWQYKPVSFVGYGAGSGGARAVEHLRLVFAELSAATTRRAVLLYAPWEHLDGDRLVPGPGADAAADATLDELTWWARALRTARRAGPLP